MRPLRAGRAQYKKLGECMKTQMKFQRIMCIIMIIVGALSVVCSFLFCSGGMANIGMTLDRNAGNIVYREGFEAAQQVYLDAQSANNLLFIFSLIIIVAGALLYVTATNKRRRYYVSNYVATGAVCALDMTLAVYMLVIYTTYLNKFNDIINDPALNAKFHEIDSNNPLVTYDASIWNFVLGIIACVLVVLACVGLILNLVWKIKLMKGEDKLLSAQLIKEEA